MSKFLLDENLSYKLVYKLAIAMDVIHVSSKGLLQSPDNDIWEVARKEQFTIITRDRDFKYLSQLYGCPPKVIKLNCENQSTANIAEIILKAIDIIRRFILSNELCYLELT